MNDHDDRPAAKVQLVEDGVHGDVLHGWFEEMPWGLGSDFCFDIALNSGQRVLVWLEGMTEGPPSRLVLQDTGEPS